MSTTSCEPVSVEDKNTQADHIEDGIALCLSGGGYRAMLFHLGILLRLNEVGILGRLRRISSVSGGSITAGQLGLQWRNLDFHDGVARALVDCVINPIRSLAGRTIDAKAIIVGGLIPGLSVSDRIAAAYRKFLYGKATLQDLPTDGEGPRFVINATNVQSGALWRFSRPYMGDYKVGLIPNPRIELALAVTASSAFPPILSPVSMKLQSTDFTPDPGTTLQREPYTNKVVLTDGGVYDNLGLETAWKRYRTILVSDGGGRMAPDPTPKGDWARHALRVNGIIDNQVRSLRKRQLIDAFKVNTVHNGAYWGIRSRLQDYGGQIALSCPENRTEELASTPTRLQSLPPGYQERLINWGYAICAAATNTYFQGPINALVQFPYPDGV